MVTEFQLHGEDQWAFALLFQVRVGALVASGAGDGLGPRQCNVSITFQCCSLQHAPSPCITPQCPHHASSRVSSSCIMPPLIMPHPLELDSCVGLHMCMMLSVNLSRLRSVATTSSWHAALAMTTSLRLACNTPGPYLSPYLHPCGCIAPHLHPDDVITCLTFPNYLQLAREEIARVEVPVCIVVCGYGQLGIAQYMLWEGSGGVQGCRMSCMLGGAGHGPQAGMGVPTQGCHLDEKGANKHLNVHPVHHPCTPSTRTSHMCCCIFLNIYGGTDHTPLVAGGTGETGEAREFPPPWLMRQETTVEVTPTLHCNSET